MDDRDDAGYEIKHSYYFDAKIERTRIDNTSEAHEFEKW